MTVGFGILVLKDHRGRVIEELPPQLIREAIKALPDDCIVRHRLLAWSNATHQIAVTRHEIEEVLIGALEYAHLNETELGGVGRIPEFASSGQIIGISEFEKMTGTISVVIVLALCLRRMLMLEAVGARFAIKSDSEAL